MAKDSRSEAGEVWDPAETISRPRAFKGTARGAHFVLPQLIVEREKRVPVQSG
jgi:hypothetical protein